MARARPVTARTKRPLREIESLADFRRQIDSRIVNMILDTLSDEQRELLAATCGNPYIEKRLECLITTLLGAERVLRAAGVASAPIADALSQNVDTQAPSCYSSNGE